MKLLHIKCYFVAFAFFCVSFLSGCATGFNTNSGQHDQGVAVPPVNADTLRRSEEEARKRKEDRFRQQEEAKQNIENDKRKAEAEQQEIKAKQEQQRQAAERISSASATDMPPLAKQYGCIACHAIDKKVVGPAWMDVSKKYKGLTQYTYRYREYPLEAGLMLKVSMGGNGSWGSVPMIANDPGGVHQADIGELVKFILALSK